jgi:transcriptional regulator GlxA family with amidase domain
MAFRSAGVVAECGIAERSLKRRFAAATGSTVIGYVQNLRIEEAKRLLEAGDMPSDDIAAAAGYENPAFFRKLFKRCTGLTMESIAVCSARFPKRVMFAAAKQGERTPFCQANHNAQAAN